MQIKLSQTVVWPAIHRARDQQEGPLRLRLRYPAVRYPAVISEAALLVGLGASTRISPRGIDSDLRLTYPAVIRFGPWAGSHAATCEMRSQRAPEPVLHKETQASQGNTGLPRKHRLHKERQASQGSTGFTRKHRLHKEAQASQGKTGFTRKHRPHKETQASQGSTGRTGPASPSLRFPRSLCFPSLRSPRTACVF
jgi:hypothetical protein